MLEESGGLSQSLPESRGIQYKRQGYTTVLRCGVLLRFARTHQDATQVHILPWVAPLHLGSDLLVFLDARRVGLVVAKTCEKSVKDTGARAVSLDIDRDRDRYTRPGAALRLALRHRPRPKPQKVVHAGKVVARSADCGGRQIRRAARPGGGGLRRRGGRERSLGILSVTARKRAYFALPAAAKTVTPLADMGAPR